MNLAFTSKTRWTALDVSSYEVKGSNRFKMQRHSRSCDAPGFQKALGFIAFAMLLLCGMAAGVQAQLVSLPASPALQPENSLQDLQRDLGDIFNDPNFSNAFWGVCVQSLETGQYYFRLNDARSFLPASNLKLFTAAEALSLLGPDFHYTTELLTTGKLSEHSVHGDLIIRGSGDPTIGAYNLDQGSSPLTVFNAWADSLHRMGVTKIEGNIVGDDTYFTDQLYPLGWAIEDLPYYYAMQSSALSFAENQITVTVRPGATTGDKVRYEIVPATKYVVVENNATTKADSLVRRLSTGIDSVIATGSTTIEVVRATGSNAITITGQIPRSGAVVTEQLSVENPTLYAATVLRETLEARGIRVVGTSMSAQDLEKRIPYLKARVLAQHASPPVADIVRLMNKQSDNMYAEQLFRTVAKEQRGEGSWTKGVEVMKEFLSNAGIVPDRLAIYDGSGLSRMDLIAPIHMVTLLRNIYQQKKLFPVFFNSLPIMGVDGTIAHRLTDTKAQGNVHAKTGFLTGVRSISGYLTTRDNELLAFSIIGNNFTTPTSLANNLQDLVLLRLVNFSRK
jgi:D-alanyl-D-alanine carboxypeptidase/D-alanyl-D-alanine-endopeptidase (penicillin-binding protein 4)